MRIGRWIIQYQGTRVGDFDRGWWWTLRTVKVLRLADGGLIADLGPFTLDVLPKP